MSRWGEENFDSDSARSYLEEILQQLVETLEKEFELKKAGKILGESDIMPCIDIILTLAKGYPDFVPYWIQEYPISKWKTSYLKIFDEEDEVPDDERRAVIVRTFNELEIILENLN